VATIALDQVKKRHHLSLFGFAEELPFFPEQVPVGVLVR
jgi:hypothetical protein